jgi:acetyltransferase-like isoleucine patch superfamily enzyme
MAARPRIHPTAIVEAGVEIGTGTCVWDNVHIRSPSKVGRDCIVGGKTYIAYGTWIGDRVKINSFVYICTAVKLETGVMVAAGVTFTNDIYPRATTPELDRLLKSEPTDATLPTLVCEGATIGARAVIGPGLTIGRFAMVGMGSVLTCEVPDFHLVLGHPARSVGCVCRCGRPLCHWDRPSPVTRVRCGACGRAFEIRPGETVAEIFEKVGSAGG